MGIYLDYNAGAPLRAEARAAIDALLASGAANASSVHGAGRTARAALETARADVAALIAAEPHDLVFTSGGTEANNLAVAGVARAGGAAGDRPGRAGAVRHLVTTAVEHASVLETCRALVAEGFDLTCVGVDADGRVDATALAAALRPETVLVSVGLANNEIGTLQPIEAIARETRARGVPLHVDAVQAVGKLPVAVGALGADLVSLSAHKLGGPPGIGALYVRRGLRLRPLLAGGPQERERRAGTENLIGAVGFGAAARAARATLAHETARDTALIARLWEGICAAVPDALRNSPAADVLPNTLNVSFPGADAEALVIGLDLCGLAVSAGSACAAGALEPSHVLLAMGRPAAAARAALRVSVGFGTTTEHVDALIAALPAVVARSRAVREAS